MRSYHRDVYLTMLAPVYVFQRGPTCWHKGKTGVSHEAVNGNALRICSEYFSYLYLWINYLVFLHYSFTYVVNIAGCVTELFGENKYT